MYCEVLKVRRNVLWELVPDFSDFFAVFKPVILIYQCTTSFLLQFCPKIGLREVVVSAFGPEYNCCVELLGLMRN